MVIKNKWTEEYLEFWTMKLRIKRLWFCILLCEWSNVLTWQLWYIETTQLSSSSLSHLWLSARPPVLRVWPALGGCRSSPTYRLLSRAFLPPSSFSPNTSCSCVSSAKPSRSKCALMLSKSPQSTQSNISFCIDVILRTVSEANLHWNLPLPWLQDSTTRLWRARQN